MARTVFILGAGASFHAGAPLMSDFYPHGEVAEKYGVLTRKGYAERVVFLIDKKGIIRFIERVPITELPDNRKLFEALAKLT